MASSACSSTKNPLRKLAKIDYIDLSSNKTSPIHPQLNPNTTIDTTLALTMPPPTSNQTTPMVEPLATSLPPRALTFSTPPNTPIEPHPYLSSTNDAPPRTSNPFPLYISDHKRSWVKRLCTKNKVHFLGLQETMTSKVDEFRIKELWNNSPFCFASKNSNGKSGGIITIWDTSCFSSIGTFEGYFFFVINGTWQSLETSCLMVIVYAPQSQAKKTSLWSELTIIILDHDNLTIVMGDFNEVRSTSERMGSVFNQNGALKFNEFIANIVLMDLPLGRKRFTRINKHGSKLSKLDRIMVSRHFVDK
nr:cytochrome P450 [Tanacetum cinerariifolium]